MKKCKKCELEKELKFFGKDKNTKDGLKSQCKKCRNISNKKYRDLNKEYHKNYRNNNKEKNKEYQKKYRSENSENIKKLRNKYKLENNDKIKQSNQLYYQNNKEIIKDRKNKWIENNKEKYNEIKKKWYNEKRKEDKLFHLRTNISSLIRNSLKSGGFSKNTKTFNIIGCSYEDLLFKLNNNKYGFIFEEGIYDIDHIIPVSTAECEEDLIKLNHYTNLQLIPSEYNRYIKKDNPWDIEDFEQWLKDHFFITS